MAESVTVERSVQVATPHEAVVSAVAELNRTDPISIEPLYTAIDPDALDALFEADRPGTNRSPRCVEFTYCGCDVVVSGDGEVRASKAGEERSRRWR